MSDTPRTDAEDAIWKRDYNNHRECDWPPISDVVCLPSSPANSNAS